MKDFFKELTRFFLVMLTLIMLLVISIDSTKAQSIQFAYNSTEVTNYDLTVAHNLPAGQEFQVTGYACGIGSNSTAGRIRNEALASARAEVLADSLRAMGHTVTVTIAFTMAPSQRGAEYWSARAVRIETDSHVETGLTVETSADDSMSTVDLSVDSLQGQDSTKNLSAGSDSLQSPRQHEGSVSVKALERQPLETSHSPVQIPATAAQVLDSMLSAEGMECDCNFPSELTPKTTLAWRRSSYVVRDKVNSHTKAHGWAECGDRCLKLLLRMEHEIWGLHSGKRLGAKPTPSQKYRASQHEAKERERRAKAKAKAQKKAMKKSTGMSWWDELCVLMGWSCK